MLRKRLVDEYVEEHAASIRRRLESTPPSPSAATFLIEKTKMTWERAKRSCEARGMRGSPRRPPTTKSSRSFGQVVKRTVGSTYREVAAPGNMLMARRLSVQAPLPSNGIKIMPTRQTITEAMKTAWRSWRKTVSGTIRTATLNQRMSFCELYYEVVTTPKTWTEAAYHCASLGKKLVKPISEDSNRAVMTALEEGPWHAPRQDSYKLHKLGSPVGDP